MFRRVAARPKEFRGMLSIWTNLFVVYARGARSAFPTTATGECDMPEYLLSVWHDEEYEVDFSGDEMQRIAAQVEQFNAELQETGAWVYANGLQPASSATVVKADGGKVSMTDGPYAESKEQMGGFWVVEAADFDSALKLGEKGAAACEGPVEVRPFQTEAP
jgi:hypothetical protein